MKASRRCRRDYWLALHDPRKLIPEQINFNCMIDGVLLVDDIDCTVTTCHFMKWHTQNTDFCV